MRVAVVGGGVLGSSVAYHLARAGAQVVLFDAALPGRATDAGAGIICPWASQTREDVWHRIAGRAAEYYGELIPALAACGAGDAAYRRVGTLCVDADHARLDRTETFVRAKSGGATPRDATLAGALTRLAPDQARRLFPLLDPALSALHIAGGARVDGRLLVRALRRSAARHGARFEAGIAGLLLRASRLVGVRVGSVNVEADAVVLAAGAWAPALLAPLGLASRVTPQRGQIVHLRLECGDTADWPVILPPSSYYMLAFDDSRIVVGATRETGAGFDHRVTAAGQAEVLSAALSVAPGLAGATVIETRVGFRPVGPDILPMLGVLTGVGVPLVIGNGLGPSGLTIGPYAGLLLAQLTLGAATELDLAPYDPLRVGGTSEANAGAALR